MTGFHALLFPSHPAVVAGDGSHLEVVDFLERRVLRADGLLARELSSVLDGAEPGPLFAALGPLGALALRLRGEPRTPLTPASALRLRRFETLFLELTLECTERCVHCYADAGPERTERLDRKTALEALEDAATLGFSSVQFTGGDPLLCPFLEELLERSRSLGFATREVFSNGLLLDETRLTALAAYEPSFAFSLYSADPATHDRITRIPGSHQRTLAAIERACRAGLEVRVATVSLAENAGQASTTLALARALGAHTSQPSTSHAVGRGGHFEGAPGPTELEPEPGAEAEARGEPVGAETDSAHGGTLCVAGDGAVYPCVFNRADRLGRLGERRLREIVEAPEVPGESVDPALFLTEVRRRLQCVSCQCTAWALRRSGGKPWA